ncbi:ScbR family autoregulator-binding transcription factor [Streptomyces sp. NPDC093510]|uniref:ScbR family autoregulator-binding transcription factor n=1 Tax=Streptomyces sp. NPDC093510 TaxID=3155199 RepID=UPI0034373C50
MSKQERATRTRNALILSAAELFDQHGYVRTSLDEISTRAGVSRGALHFHFANKAALAHAVEQAAADTLQTHATQLPLPHTNALQHLMNLTHQMIHLLHHDTIVRAGFRLNCDTTPQTPHDLRRQWHTCVHQLVTRATREHALPIHINPDALTTTIVATTTGLEILSRTHPQWLTPTTLTHIWQLLLPATAH